MVSRRDSENTPVRTALKVGVSGVRGIVGEGFTPQVAAAFAQAFGVFVGRGPVLVGRDTRPSGLMIERAVTAGLRSVGAQPVCTGPVPTPSLLRRIPSLHARGGIVITASHNAAPWNALKFADRNGLFLSSAWAEELFDLYHQKDFHLVSEAEIPEPRLDETTVREHLDAVLAAVDADTIRARGFRVAIDPVNGVGGLCSVPFLRDGLGCTVFPVHAEPHGLFEREPEPLPEHLGALGQTVREQECDLGFAQDPDGDRLAVVDAEGNPVGEDCTLAFAVQQVLAAHRRGPVVINMTASRCIEQIAESFGCEVVRTQTGEIHVVNEMLRRNAAVGGENIGGVIFPKVHSCRDSFAAMALILERLATDRRSVRAWRDALPPFYIEKRKLTIDGPAAPALLRRLRRRYADRPLDLRDGVWIGFPAGWVCVRRSNTEPVLRITAEGETPELAARWADEVQGVLG